MALTKRVFEEETEGRVFDFFTKEEIQKNLTFLMLVEAIFHADAEQRNRIIQVIDQHDENSTLYYTNDKFLEIIDLYGLDGFIY